MTRVHTTPSPRLRVQRTLPFERATAPRLAPVPQLARLPKERTPRSAVRPPLVLAEWPVPPTRRLDRTSLPARVMPVFQMPVFQVLGAAFVFAVCLAAAAYL